MKKVVLLCCTLAAMVFASCDNNETPGGYEGTNYISLSSDTQVIYSAEASVNEAYTLTATLTSVLDKDLALEFEVKNDPNNVLALANNPVTIPAGQNSANFAVKLAKVLDSDKPETFAITLAGASNNVLEKDLKIMVYPMEVTAPSTDQEGIITAYRTASGIDLSKYLGAVKCEMTLTYRDDNEIVVVNNPVKTFSVIELDESSTEEYPVLNMTVNAMGVNDVMHNNLRNLTVASEQWNTPAAEGEEEPDYFALMRLINWNKDSDEVFNTSLQGIKLAEEIEFIPVEGEGEDAYGIIPLEFYFSAYEREVAEEWTSEYYTTSNPAELLNLYNTVLDEAYWEPDDENSTETTLFVEPSASISNEKMEFTFCFSDDNYADYAKVHVVYTPNE